MKYFFSIYENNARFINEIFNDIVYMMQNILPLWSHQMDTFSALLAICAGNIPVPGEFTAQRPVTRSFDVFFDLRLNKRLSKQSWGWWLERLSCPLWRHCNAMGNQPWNHASTHHMSGTRNLFNLSPYYWAAKMTHAWQTVASWIIRLSANKVCLFLIFLSLYLDRFRLQSS